MPRFHADSLRKFGEALLESKGMSAADAATVASSLDWADRSGISSHGIAFLPRYLDFIDAGDLDPQARPELISQPPGLPVIEAHRAAGAVAMNFAVDVGIEALTQSASAMIWIRRMTHCGAMGQYLERAALHGAIAMAWTAGQPLMAYHGTARAAATTGPLVMAAPGPDGKPIVLDMATSDISFSRLRQARRLGQPLPPDSALDAQGHPTTDADKAVTPLPIAGPKGAGIALMFEMMTSLVLGNPITEPYLNAKGRPRHGQNAFLMLARVDAFSVDGSRYNEDVKALVETLRGQPRSQGVEEILMPGERRRRSRERHEAGAWIEVNPVTWGELCDRARQSGVNPPEVG